MLRKVILGFLILLCTLMAAGVYLFPFLIDKDSIKNEIALSFKALTGLDVEIEGEAIIQRFPTPRVVVNSMYVHNAQGATAPFLLTVKLVEVWPSYRSLLTKHVTIQKIHIDDVQVEIERLKNGEMNWKDSAVQTSLPQNVSKYISDVSSALVGAKINMTNGYFHYADAITGTSAEYDDVSVTFTNGGANYESTLGVAMRFRDRPLTMSGKVGSIPYALSVGEVPANLQIASGKSEATYAGMAGFKDGKFVVNGNVRLSTDDVIYWIDAMMGTTGSAAPEETSYKPLSFEAKSSVVTTNSNILLPDLTLDGAIIKGGAHVEISPPYEVSVNAAINFLDMEAVSASKLFESKLFELTGSGDSKKKGSASSDDSGFVMAQKSVFELLKLNAEIKIDDIMYNQQHVRDARVSFDMNNGEMTISQAVAKLPGDTRMVFAGIGKQGFQGFALEGEVDASGADFSEAVKVLKANGASFPTQDFKRFRLKANALLSAKELRLSEIKSRIENMAFLGGFIATFGKRIKMQAAMRIGGVNFDHFIDLWGIPEWRTSLADTTPDAKYDSFLARWLRRLDYDTTMNISLEQFILNGVVQDKASLHLKTVSGKVYFNDVKAFYNGSNITGDFMLDVTGPLPHIDITAALDTFDFDKFFGSKNAVPMAQSSSSQNAVLYKSLATISPAAGNASPPFTSPDVPVLPTSATQPNGPASPADTPPPQRWSHQKFDFHWLDLLTVSFHFKFNDYKQGLISGHPLDVLGSVENQILTIESLSGRIQGAQMAAKVVVKGGAIPAIQVAANIVSLDPVQLLPFLPVLQGMTGKYNFSIRLDSTGVDMFSWISSLEGSVGVGGENVDIHGFNLAGVIHAVSYVRTVADILSVVRRAFPGGDTMFTNIEGQWTVAGGVLKTSGSRLTNEQADGVLTSQVDLVNWLVQTSINLSLKTLDRLHPPGMIITFNGNLDSPQTSLDTRSLEEYVTNKTSEQMLKEYGTH